MAGKNGNKVHGRNKGRPSQKAYVIEKRSIKNKEKKVLRHLKKHPNDKQSIERPVVNYKKRA